MILTKLVAVGSRLFLGVYLLICVSLLYRSAPASPFVPLGLSLVSPIVGVEISLLLFGLAIVAQARLERIRIWGVLLSLGIISTILSAIHVVGSSPPPPDVCAILFYNYGFPFPWYRVTGFHEPVSGPLCFLPLIVSPRVDLTALVFDMIFYAGLYFAAGNVSRYPYVVPANVQRGQSCRRLGISP